MYRYNEECGCVWCENGGEAPFPSPSLGHSFAYECPHIPPRA